MHCHKKTNIARICLKDYRTINLSHDQN